MKRKFLFISIFIYIAFTSRTQVDSVVKYVPPIFEGGQKAMTKYFLTYANYPQGPKENDISDFVDATIYINKEGKVKFVNALGKIPEFNAEVKRIFKLMPNWTPGTKSGMAIDTMINQRVFFTIKGFQHEMAENDIEFLIWSRPMTSLDFKEDAENFKLQKRKNNEAMNLNKEGSSLYQEKKFEEALIKFSKAIEIGGEQNLYLYNRGLTYLNLKVNDKAKEDFLEAYRKGDEDSGKIYNNLFK